MFHILRGWTSSCTSYFDCEQYRIPLVLNHSHTNRYIMLIYFDEVLKVKSSSKFKFSSKPVECRFLWSNLVKSTMMWGPLVISWFIITPSNYSYISTINPSYLVIVVRNQLGYLGGYILFPTRHPTRCLGRSRSATASGSLECLERPRGRPESSRKDWTFFSSKTCGDWIEC